MSNLKYAVGIDLAKKEFKACLSVIDTQQKVTVKASSSFANSPSGFAALLQWVSKHGKEALPVLYLMEATGIYYEPLAWFLYQKAQPLTVILPNKAKKYLQSLGLKSKNDRIDAQGLSRLAAQQQHRLWQPLSQQIYVLRSLTRLHQSLTQHRTALSNQLQASEWSMYELKLVREGLSNALETIDKELLVLEKQIKQLIEQDALLKDKYEKISIIKGVGLLTFAVLVAETNGFELFENQSQLVSYAGYDVVENQSGNKVGKTRISKKGNTRIRRILYMPALCAVTHQEPGLKALYERVYSRSGIKMKGYVAVQKKLLCLIYTLWKKDEKYDSTFGQQPSTASSNEEPKSLFAVVFEENPNVPPAKKKVAPAQARATQDKLPCNQSPEVFFRVGQSY